MAGQLERLARGEPARLYLLHGEETFLVERGLRTLRERFAPGEDWRVVWGDDEGSRVEDAFAAMASPGLFAGAASVVLRRAEALRGAVEAALERVLEHDRDAGRLVLVGGVIDRRRRWYATAARLAVECRFSAVTDVREAQGWIERFARERGARLDAGAAAELLERCGADLALLDAEIDKLALCAAGGAVDREAVRRLVPALRAHAIEELTDCLARGDRTGATRVLRSLLADGEPGLRILAFVAANLRRALHAVELGESGLSPGAVAARLGMPEWLVQKQLGRGPARRLEAALAALAWLDAQLKRSRPEGASFDAVLAKLAGPSGR